MYMSVLPLFWAPSSSECWVLYTFGWSYADEFQKRINNDTADVSNTDSESPEFNIFEVWKREQTVPWSVCFSRFRVPYLSEEHRLESSVAPSAPLNTNRRTLKALRNVSSYGALNQFLLWTEGSHFFKQGKRRYSLSGSTEKKNYRKLWESHLTKPWSWLLWWTFLILATELPEAFFEWIMKTFFNTGEGKLWFKHRTYFIADAWLFFWSTILKE